MYPEIMVIPMREELMRVGAEELRTAEAVDAALQRRNQTVLVVVNSICGCAAGRMRPAVRMALEGPNRPDRVVTVFAGQDPEATQRAREYFRGYPPSSPSIGLMRDGELLYFMQRGDIETRQAHEIAGRLTAAFDQFCAKPAVAENN
jgi:putative YphP/YqiW family bacilliredoxin